MTRQLPRYQPDQWGIPRQRIDDPVRAWPTYFLKRITPELRDNLNAQAERDDVSVADVIRGILCSHYRLDCPPRSRCFEGGIQPQTEHMILRLQPALWRSIRDDQKISERPIRTLVIETLQNHYENEENP